MALKVIAGPAGSGKTSYIVSSIVQHLAAGGAAGASASGGTAGGLAPVIFLVPDQATFQMERRILDDPRVEGFMDVHVLSFRRLCLKVLEQTGGLSLPFITVVGRSMAIQSILWEHRKDLTVFAPMVNYPGFRETLGRTLSELSAYDVTPSSMRGLGAAEAMPFLDQKIHDLAVVFEEYREFLKGRFFDPDDYLELAAERMSGSGLVKGATVWIDGFSGFTPKEYKVVKAILEAAAQVNLALCTDRAGLARPADPTGLFHPTRETYDKVVAMAWDAGVAVEEPVLLEGGGEVDGGLPESRVLPRFREAPELAALERWVRADGNPVGPATTAAATMAGPSVRVISATNPLAELEFVAREVLKLVRDEGLRYRDITVEARDLGEYAEMLPLVFRDHGIPFFLDRKRPLSHHPLAELIRSALDVVLTSWSVEAVFRYLKTDLVPVGRDQVDVLENYVLSHGIVGEKWLSEEPWRYTRKYLVSEEEAAEKEEQAAIADAIRREAVAALREFYRRLKGGRGGGDSLTARDISQAICDLLLELDVPKTLARWQSLAEQAGDLAEAIDHAGLWDKVMEILAQAGEILKDQPHDLKSNAMLISAGLEDVRLGAIPPSLDQVLVGSLDRSRQPECKATFLIGALLGVFPKRQTEDSIFTDAEREYLKQKGVDLEPASSLRQFHEKYLVYIGLTRPARRLYVSYSLGDQEGKALTPSYVIDLLKRALPSLEEELVSGDPPGTMPGDLDYVLPARVGGIAARRLSMLRKGVDPGEAWTEAYRWLVSPERVAESRRILSSLSYSNKVPSLDRSLVRDLYGQTLLTSVSRLEAFGACPFQHFARDGLGLKERDIYRLEPADAGVFLHAALKAFVDEVARSGRDWAGMSDIEALGLVDGVVERLVPEVADELFISSARYRYVAAALRRILRRAGGLLLSHMKRGSFRPLAAEIRFGSPGGARPYRVELPGKEEVLLRGQIDRIDAAAATDGLYLRVVDYKSSPRSLDFLDIYSGLALQLMVYLLVALDSWEDVRKVAVGAGGIAAGLAAAATADAVGGATAGGARQAAARADTAAAALADMLLGGRVVPRPAGALYFSVMDPLVSEPGPVTPDEAQRGILRRLRMSGLVAGEIGVARLMDGASSGHSDIIPVQFLSGGRGLGAKSSAVAGQDLSALLDFVRDKVRDVSAEIFSGKADIAPFRRGAVRACQYCPYGPLCSFDVLLAGNRYRIIRPVAPESLWDEIRRHRRGEGGAARG